METFPVKGDAIPLDPEGKPYNGWLLFLDELTSAIPSVQAAAYKLLLDRMVGVHDVHEQVYMVAAGNLESDNAVVHSMSTALQSRLIHIQLRLDVEEWIDWAIVNKIDHRITDFIQFKPDALYTFNPDHTDKTYACPRTWAFSDAVIKACNNDLDDPDMIYLLSGCVSDGVAREFEMFAKIYTTLPKMSDIVANPTIVPVPKEASINFAMCGSLANYAKKDKFDSLMKYIQRMSVEFQVVTMRQVLKKDPTMRTHPSILAWVQGPGAALMRA